MGRAYFVTAVLAERNQYFFNDMYCGRLVVNEMRRIHDDGEVESITWVVMPDHVHWLFQLGEKSTLSAVMKKFKARSALAVNRYLKREGAVWQKAFYDHALRDDEDIQQIARYIVANPLRAGLVESVGDYPLWDAKWL